MPEKLSHGPRANSDLNRCAGLSRGPNLQKKLTAAAWSNTFPAPGATLDLDFANNRGFVRGVGQGGSMDAVTFTRASSGNWVDSTGTLRTGAGSFTGTANALGNNLLTFPQDFNNAAWTKSGVSVIANTSLAPDETNTADNVIPTNTASSFKELQQTASMTSGVTYTFSIYCKANGYNYIQIVGTATQVGTFYFTIDLSNGTETDFGAGTSTIVNRAISSIGNGWYRITVAFTALATGSGRIAPNIVPASNSARGVSWTGDGTSGVLFWGAQLELDSSATAYYPTNINVPRFDWASTESTGAGTAANPYVIPLQANPTCNGLLIEESRANRLLWCRDATQTNWTKTNVTAAKDQTGIDGVANAASSLTASAAGGTCIQTITLASGSRTGSVYLKRLTGTGNIQVSLDGSTWSTVDLSNGLWNRIVISGTVTNPTVGIKIATNGDAVAMDYGQVEDGVFATSPILTTTASVTRSADVASITGQNFSGWYTQNEGTTFVECVFNGVKTTQQTIFVIEGSSVNNSHGLLTSGGPINISYFANVAAVTQFTIFLGGPVVGTAYKISASYRNNDYAVSLNKKVPSKSSGLVPAVNRAYIGSTSNGFPLTGTIKRIVYYPKQLNNNVLQILSGDAT